MVLLNVLNDNAKTLLKTSYTYIKKRRTIALIEVRTDINYVLNEPDVVDQIMYGGVDKIFEIMIN